MPRPAIGAAASAERFFQFSLLGLVASGYFAVAGSGYLDKPTIFLTAIGLLVRALLVSGVLHFEIPEFVVNALTLAYIAFYPVDCLFLSDELLTATVHLVFFLAIMKILTAKTNRDYLYIAAIAFLELLAAAVLSASSSFFAFLALYLLFAIAAFTSAEIRRALQKPAKVARGARIRFSPRLAVLASTITVGILVLTSGLFFILPRTANAALRHLVARRYHLSGFSNEVNLGDIGEIQSDSRAIMHVQFYSREAPANLRWRGSALSRFDGRKWSAPHIMPQILRLQSGRAQVADDWERSRTDGRHILYRVDLNTVDSDALFIAGVPEMLNLGNVRVLHTATDGFRLGFTPSEVIHYEVQSFVEDRNAPHRGVRWLMPDNLRSRYLQLPSLDPRVPELAAKIAGPATQKDWARAAAIEKYLRSSYGYTLQLPATDIPDPLANFLFVRKKGHCEYFASAMAVMLRSVGIPARLVNGFQSGTFNPISGLYVVRASDAHSWVEAFLPDRGWAAFDPTPAASRTAGDSIWARVALYLDAADTFWQEWVMSYDLGRQLSLAERIQDGTRSVRWDWFTNSSQSAERWKHNLEQWLRRYGVWLFSLVAIAAALLTALPRCIRAYAGWRRIRKTRRGEATAADATLLYERMLLTMKRRGFQKPPWFTPREFASTLPKSSAAAVAEQFTMAYNALRFGGDVSVAPQLGELLEKLEKI